MSNCPLIEKPTINICTLFPALVFFRLFLDCLKRIHKKFSKSHLCVQSEGDRQFFNELKETQNSDLLKPSSSFREDGNIRREDVEMVMDRLGFPLEIEDGRKMMDHERLISFNSEEVSKLFEEKEVSLEEVKAAFDVFDENRDGFLDSEEVGRVVCNLLGGFKEGFRIDEECTKMIRPYDLNGDGMIDFQEFVKLIEKSFC